MTVKREDKRVKMTKLLLEDALIKQMATQHISKISVRALCEEAGINRSTFYAHYADQYALLRALEQKVLTSLNRYLQVQQTAIDQPITAPTLKRILDYIKANAGLFQALLSDNSEYAFQQSVVQLTQIFTVQRRPVSDERLEVYVHSFCVMGCISVLKQWLQDGMIESTQTMTDFIMQMLYQGALALG